ncbi:HU family DNA-binding protein [uncultured Desulfovibrio sp.]|uniref:HU family DNA-binding protein n=1 Tax=uncultured Desulfovibrio sp. TaxID=167968 RepID=UPI00265CC816|nr:HU family DNA-binding protein [uncultured Desulfovibrio sp.]
MMKRELIEKALETARNSHERAMTLADMGAALDSLCEVAAAELLGGGEVSLPGLGKLKMRETAAREGRNPRTGESLHIPAGKKVVFVPGKDLKEALKP